MTTDAGAPTTVKAGLVLCTHNPRLAYLARCLQGLRNQTLPLDQWELALIDNASDEPLSARVDLSWHPRSKHVREERLGLTHARLCGLAETAADLLVFVDDDNVLNANYLETALAIANAWPMLGTWGGQCLAEFEVPPAEHLTPHLESLAIRTCDRDSWSNLPTWSDAFPYGAGMCVRRKVMIQYRTIATSSPVRLSLDRSGKSLFSAGDYDINLTACDIGLGCGVFQALELVHIIPAQRVAEDYMLRLEYGLKYSNTVLQCLRGMEAHDPWASWRARLKWKLSTFRRSTFPRRFRRAGTKGVCDALLFWREHSHSCASP